MKLKCNDGVVRNFRISEYNKFWEVNTDAFCLECGYNFGVHDTKILKPMFKKHVCRKENKGRWEKNDKNS